MSREHYISRKTTSQLHNRPQLVSGGNDDDDNIEVKVVSSKSPTCSLLIISNTVTGRLVLHFVGFWLHFLNNILNYVDFHGSYSYIMSPQWRVSHKLRLALRFQGKAPKSSHPRTTPDVNLEDFKVLYIPFPPENDTVHLELQADYANGHMMLIRFALSFHFF